MSTNPLTEAPSTQAELEEGEVAIESDTSSQEKLNENENSKHINETNQEDTDDECAQGFFLNRQIKDQPKQSEAQKKKRERSRSPHSEKSNCSEKEHQKQDIKKKNNYRPFSNVGLCKYYLNGKCIKGDKCPYSHRINDFPCKFFVAKGFCDHKHCKFAHKRLSREEMTKFIHDNKQYLLEERQKYGKTKIDRYIDEYLKKENYYQTKNFAQNFYNGTQADILTINNANNIILNYQLMNNALLTGAISLMNMNYFPVEHLGYQNMMYQTMPQGEQNVKKEEEKSNEIPKESEEGSKANEDGPKDPRIRNKK